jgi:hypothetical protein
MHAKVSPRGLRFFAHDVACRGCPLNGETADHRLLKSAIAAAVRLAGWQATLEATGPDGRWRADVLATSPDGTRTVAWEAQLAYQHDDDTRARTHRYVQDGVEVVWVFARLVLGEIPAVTVTVDQSSIQVAAPIARLTIEHCAPGACSRYHDLRSVPPCPGHGRWEPVTLGFDAFVGLLCRADIRFGPLEAATASDGSKADRLMVNKTAVKNWWTSPAFQQRAKAVRTAQHITDASVAGERAQIRRRREQQLRQEQDEAERHETNREALHRRQKRLQPFVVRSVGERLGTMPWALNGDYEHAMGISIVSAGRVVAVICPIAARITAEIAERLAQVTVYVASEHERQMVARRCRSDQQFIVVSDPAS